MKYTIDGIEFSSRKAVKDHCREIRDRVTGKGVYDVDPDAIFYLDGSDKTFFVDLIKHLPTAHKIIGCGIAEIAVCCVNEGKSHWGFRVMRIDASETVFGFGKFGESIEQVSCTRFTKACRNAVKDQTIAYKQEYFDGMPEALCEATGVLMNQVDCHVDHENPTFKELVDEFFGSEKDVALCEDAATESWQIADDSLRNAWQDFHRSKAKLRCTTRRFNLTRKKDAST